METKVAVMRTAVVVMPTAGVVSQTEVAVMQAEVGVMRAEVRAMAEGSVVMHEAVARAGVCCVALYLGSRAGSEGSFVMQRGLRTLGECAFASPRRPDVVWQGWVVLQTRGRVARESPRVVRRPVGEMAGRSAVPPVRS